MGEVDEGGSASPRWYDHCWFYLLAAMLHLNTITWIINHMGQLVLTALIIIFQPELRKRWNSSEAKISSQTFLFLRIPDSRKDIQRRPVNEITRAAFEMGKVKTGALIVIERDLASRRSNAWESRWTESSQAASDQYF